MMQAIVNTDFHFPQQTGFYKGKVRDVYTIRDKYLIMIVTDRISAFDVILPRGIPYKGQVLNQIAGKFLDATCDIVPNWKLASPHPMVTAGIKAEPFKVEMVVRGYLAGHSWREYKDGRRTICGVPMPEGMKENDPFPEPVITPTTKAQQGHDEDISKDEIIRQGIVPGDVYEQIEAYSLALFKRGSEIAAQKGLLLVDTKYEFGQKDGHIYLLDEIHTPDSSRYFYADGYEQRQRRGEKQKQLSKEFVREWLISNNFQGKEGQVVPDMPDDFVRQISERYVELYEHIIGDKFIPVASENILSDLEQSVLRMLKIDFDK